jgi:hypothetical protein
MNNKGHNFQLIIKICQARELCVEFVKSFCKIMSRLNKIKNIDILIAQC